ncbi:MAG: PDZ domain-containing protein, partial [Anaerolineae bacterium]|nr:PDZ domain-containing protein [Anaerolineae bacterium]
MKNFFLLLLALLMALPVFAIGEEETPEPGEANIVEDEGGVQLITGRMVVTNPNVITSTVQPVIILEDQTGFVMRDLEYGFEEQTQVIAQFPDGLDTYQDGYLDYRILLPIRPTGNQHDVDHDNVEEPGVQIYQTAYWDDTRDTPYIGPLEGYGWSGAYSSARTSENPLDEGEIVGGNFLIWAPDDAQSFPSGFGADGKLFTDDDPIVDIPAGYTAVNLDTDPFTFSRANEVVFDLLEPAAYLPVDFSDLSYTEAFDALIEYAKEAYVFTDLKDVDWDALHEELRPRFEEADANNDNDAYILALYDLIQSIPDMHLQVNTPYVNAFDQKFSEEAGGGLGFALAELDDGRIIVSFVTPGGPAEEAGIELEAEVVAINGMDIEEAINAAEPFSAPFSTRELERLQQLRYAHRFPVGTEVEITYQNPDADEATTITMTAVPEFESFNVTSIYAGFDSTGLPLSYQFLDSGYGYVKVQSLFGNEGLSFDV